MGTLGIRELYATCPLERRTCANPRCARVFTTRNSRQKYCTTRCCGRAQSLALYHRRHPTAVAAPIPEPEVEPNGRTCRTCQGPLAGKATLYCRPRCRWRWRHWGGDAPPRQAPSCWAWSAVHGVLKDGPAGLDELTFAVYGATDRTSRNATRSLLFHLALPAGNPFYRGGPWVARPRHGLYCLPEEAPTVPLRTLLIDLLKQRPRTIDDLGRLLLIAPATAREWLQAAKTTHRIERCIPPRGGQHEYFIGSASIGRVSGRRAA